MTIVLGCIADDFTGATDLAGLLARSGVKVSLRIGIPKESPAQADTSAFEIIALKCRTSPPQEAIKEARAALSWLQEGGAQRFYWKYCSTFDSTSKGNIGPVSEALMKQLGTDMTLYCPAFPENGRRVFMGNLFVGQHLLSESPMKDHPLTPMQDSNLVRLLTSQVSGKVSLIDHPSVSKGSQALRSELEAFRKEGVNHVIVDSVMDADLATIAQACHHMPLITGGSALALSLPKLYAEEGLLSEETQNTVVPTISSETIVLSGSCSEMTRQQVAHYLDFSSSYQLNALELAKTGTGPAQEWLQKQPLDQPTMIYASATPALVKEAQEKLGVEKAGHLVEDALADLALKALHKGKRRFVVAGGETSGAITKALNVTQLTIGREIAPGVPWTFCKSQGQDIALALKSGNFGKSTFFCDALEALEE